MKQIALLPVAMAIMAWALTGCNNGGVNAGPVNAGSVPAPISPLVGKWAGKTDVKGGDLAKFANSVAGGPLTGPSSMTLNADGSGFLKVADQPERPISWKQEGDRVILEERGAATSSNGEAGKTKAEGPWVGRLSEDRKTIVIDMEKVKVKLSRQKER